MSRYEMVIIMWPQFVRPSNKTGPKLIFGQRIKPKSTDSVLSIQLSILSSTNWRLNLRSVYFVQLRVLISSKRIIIFPPHTDPTFISYWFNECKSKKLKFVFDPPMLFGCSFSCLSRPFQTSCSTRPIMVSWRHDRFGRRKIQSSTLGRSGRLELGRRKNENSPKLITR